MARAVVLSRNCVGLLPVSGSNPRSSARRRRLYAGDWLPRDVGRGCDLVRIGVADAADRRHRRKNRSYTPSAAPIASRSGPSTPTVAPAVMRSPSGRSPVGQREVEGLDRDADAGGEVARAALQQQRIADAEHALGGDDRRVERVAGELQRPRAHLEDAEAAERHQQLEARGAAEARQRQALEGAIEAPLLGPRGIADEGLRLRAGALGPRAIGQQGRGAARRDRARCAARARRPRASAARPTPSSCARRRSPPTGRRPPAATGRR